MQLENEYIQMINKDKCSLIIKQYLPPTADPGSPYPEANTTNIFVCPSRNMILCMHVCLYMCINVYIYV